VETRQCHAVPLVLNTTAETQTRTEFLPKGQPPHSDKSETATTATTLAAGRVGGRRSDVLDPADLHAGTSQSAESGLGTRTRGLGTVTTGGTDLDVERSDTEFLAAGRDVLGSQHSSVGRRLITVGLDFHATSDTADRFTSAEIGDVDEGVVEAGEDAGNAKNELAFPNLGPQGNVLLRGTRGSLRGRHSS
jgi:hypothetical protein